MFAKSDYLILGAAFISFLFSIALWFGVLGPNQKDAGIFVGFYSFLFQVLKNQKDDTK